MIIDTMTIEEIQAEVSSIYPIIRQKALPLVKAFLKKAKSQLTGKPIYWKHHNIIKVGNNTILMYYMSHKGTIRDFAQVFFIQVTNSRGYKEYYQILVGGLVRKLSKHFIDRFIERTGADKDNVLIHVCRELSVVSLYTPLSSEPQFINTLNGLAVTIDGVLVTYLNDLSQYKSEIKEEAITARALIPYTRKDSIRNAINGTVVAYKLQEFK